MERLSRVHRHLVAEHDAALAQGNAFLRGEGEYGPAANRLLAFLRQHAPSMADPFVAGAVFDVARASLQFESAAKSWARAAAAAAGLASAVASLQLAAERSGQRHLDPGFQSRLRGFADEALYVLHRAGAPSGIARAAEAIVGASYLDRQILETVDVDQIGPVHAWIDRLADGARRVHLLPTDPVASVAAGEAISWAQLTTDATAAITLPPDELVNHALASQATTLVAAHVARRDVVYLISGSHGGAAVRFHHDPFDQPPDCVELPGLDLQEVSRLRDRADSIFAAAPTTGQRAVARELDAVLASIGEALAPMLTAWPKLPRVALVPVGELQSLPLASATLAGAPLSSLIDMTVVPNAQCLLTAGLRPRRPAVQTVILGDAGSGTSFLKWVEPEVAAVEHIYDRAVPGGAAIDAALSAGPPTLRALDEPANTLRQLRESSNALLDEITSGDLVHLACHGAMPTTVHDQAVLLLHGRLDVGRLLTRRFRPGCTVVLSACSVGSHVRDAPLEALGFPATLLSIGVHTLIGSLWPVADSEATVEFMAQLHQRLRDGESPSRALGTTITSSAHQGIRSTVWGGFATFGA